MDAFRIAATLHSPHYLPAYLAQELGYYANENLVVSVDVPEPWELTLEHLDAGCADAVLGGAWLPAMYYADVRRYRIFAQLSARYPLVLVSRQPVPAGDWSWLARKTLLVSGKGGVAAYVLLTGLMREHGIDSVQIDCVRDLSPAMMERLFLAGLGDGMLVSSMTAQRLVRQGLAHPVIKLDSVGEGIPSSVYYTTEQILADPDRRAWRFVRALQRAMDWIRENGVDGDAVRRVLAHGWPDDPIDDLQAIVRGYFAAGYWSDGIRIQADALHRWQQMLIANRLMTAAVPFERLVSALPLTVDTASIS